MYGAPVPTVMFRQQLWPRAFLGALAVGIAAWGCPQLLGGPDRYIDREPEATELLGAWSLTAESLANLQKVKLSRFATSDHSLRLEPDGRCRFRSYDHFSASDLSEFRSEYLDGLECSWSVSREVAFIRHRRADVPVVEIELTRGGEVCPPPAPGEPEPYTEIWMVRFYITEEDGRLILWSHVGDPDYDVYADWVREIR